MPIRILPPQVANQIAAGEVVERPASVVKELIENSLDAGATDIRVEIREGGRRLISVQDDGCGIPASEVSLAFQRHATSKIASAEDLNRITTLGFRGEALASIAAVAQVTLLARARDESVGTLLRMADGREVAREPHGMPPGVSVTVEHLFASLPARLKFLKQPATEAAHIQQVLTRYALAYPERRFSLVSDGRLVFQTSGSGKLYDVLVKVYGLEMAREMLRIGDSVNERIGESVNGESAHGESVNQGIGESQAVDAAIRVSGYTGAPGLHRGNRGYITLFINRRWFQDTTVAYAVIQAYHTLLPVGRFPVAVIFIEMDPAEVDVNVHPTKAEVRFRDPRAVFSAVQKAVRAALAEQAPVPQVGLAGPAAASAPAWGRAGWAERRDALLAAGQGHLFPSAAPAGDALAPVTRPPGDLRPATPAPPQPAAGGLLPLLRVVGQLAATYILAEGPDGLYLIDQHAAHERVLYEEMMAQYAANRLVVQPLLEPLVLDLSPEQAAVVAEELETLNQLGVAIEPFGGSSYLVRGLPAVLGREEPAEALREIIDSLARQDDLVEATHEARLVTLICKRAAVKGNTPMSMSEMQELVRRLEACRSPRTCPHGRPTMIYLSSAELARQFGRT